MEAIKNMFIRSPYNYDQKEVTIATGLECTDEHLTVQDQAEDVNDLVRMYGLTGKMPTTMRIPQSGDFTGVGTYQECLQAVKDAQNEFIKLPAKIRERFKHDPQKFIEFIEDPANSEEGEKLGIWKLKRASEEAEAKPKAESVATKGTAEKSPVHT